MARAEVVEVNIGDIIEEFGSEDLNVVTQIRPTFNAAYIGQRHNGETFLGMPDTINFPVKVLGNISLGELAEYMSSWYGLNGDISELKGEIYTRLEEEYASGPVEVPEAKIIYASFPLSAS